MRILRGRLQLSQLCSCSKRVILYSTGARHSGIKYSTTTNLDSDASAVLESPAAHHSTAS